MDILEKIKLELIEKFSEKKKNGVFVSEAKLKDFFETYLGILKIFSQKISHELIKKLFEKYNDDNEAIVNIILMIEFFPDENDEKLKDDVFFYFLKIIANFKIENMLLDFLIHSLLKKYADIFETDKLIQEVMIIDENQITYFLNILKVLEQCLITKILNTQANNESQKPFEISSLLKMINYKNFQKIILKIIDIDESYLQLNSFFIVFNFLCKTNKEKTYPDDYLTCISFFAGLLDRKISNHKKIWIYSLLNILMQNNILITNESYFSDYFYSSNLLSNLIVYIDHNSNSKNQDKNAINFFSLLMKNTNAEFKSDLFEEIFYILNEFVLHLIKPSFSRVFQIANFSEKDQNAQKSIKILIKKALNHKNIVVGKFVRIFLIQNFDKTFKFIDLFEDFLTSFDENKICKKFLFTLGKDEFLEFLSKALFFQMNKEKKGFLEYCDNLMDFLMKKIKTPTANLLFLVVLNYCFKCLEDEVLVDAKSKESSNNKLSEKIDKLLKIDQIKNSTLYINILIICKSILKNIIFHFHDNLQNLILYFEELFKVKSYIAILKRKGALEYVIKKDFLTKNLANDKKMNQIMHKLKGNNNLTQLFESLDFEKNIGLLFASLQNESDETKLSTFSKNLENYFLSNFDKISKFPSQILRKKMQKICFRIDNNQFDDFIKKVVISIKYEIDILQENDKNQINIRLLKFINFLNIFCFNQDFKQKIQNNLIESNLINFNFSEQTFDMYQKLMKLGAIPLKIGLPKIFKTIVQNEIVLNLRQIYLLIKVMNSSPDEVHALSCDEIFTNFLNKYCSIDYLIDYKFESKKFIKWAVEIFLFNFNSMLIDHHKYFIFFTKIINYFYTLSRKDIFEDKIIPSIANLFLAIYPILEIKITEELQKFLLIHSKINEIFSIALLKKKNSVLNLKFIILNILLQYDYADICKPNHSFDENTYNNFEKLWPAKYLILAHLEAFNKEKAKNDQFEQLIFFLIETHFKILEIYSSDLYMFNGTWNAIKSNILINLTIFSQSFVFEDYLFKNPLEKDNLFRKLNSMIVETNMNTKQKKTLQVFILGVLQNLKNEDLCNEMIEFLFIKNMENYNLPYQTITSIIIMSSFYLNNLIEKHNDDFSQNQVLIIKALFKQLIIYASHHFHAVKITSQIFLVDVFQSEEKLNKLTRVLNDETLISPLKFIHTIVTNNKELHFIYTSQKFIKNFNIDQIISTENLFADINDNSIYCNIFRKYYKDKNQEMLIFDNIKKIISKSFNFSPNETIESQIDIFQNRNKTNNNNGLINDLFFEDHIGLAKKDEYELIIIGSLLENLPNIAGLCRTCEILGLKDVYIKSQSIVKEEAFSKVSVTSEKILNIHELPVSKIPLFLKSKKMENYQIIALEQANNSVKLNEFMFPKKSVFIIGQEQLGIPSEVLNLCDYVVEIPQFGLIKSLNAHVASSLFIWEFIKQKHNLKSVI